MVPESPLDLENGQVSRDREGNQTTNDNAGAPILKEQEYSDSNLVDWDGPDDPENPHNFTRLRKWLITINMGVMAFCATFASSVFSTATVATASQFKMSQEVMTLGTSLFVLVGVFFRIQGNHSTDRIRLTG